MSQATPAATVILLRDVAAGPPELLLIERAAKLAFAAGAMVFPGGKVEPGDAAAAADPELVENADTLEPADAASRVAAARETFEEVGVLLTAGAALDADERTRWRTRLDTDAAGFDEFLRDSRHMLDATLLVPFAHWVPPEQHGLARRFDTRFYLARCPAGEAHAVDTTETVAAHWTTAAAALARADAGEIGVIFPTRRNLERLAQYPSTAALIEASRARPVTRIQPAIEQRSDGAWLTIPEGCDYPVIEERLDSALRG